MRKILSLALILVLALGSFATFADVDKADVANQLKDLKILVGDETGNLMLDENLTREATMVLLSRMMGQEQEASTTTLDPSFTDVNHPYYKPFIAFAEKKGWTKGIGNGLFGYGQDITVQEFTALMLRTLSYDETPYEKTMEKAKELKLLDGVEGLDPTSPILRGDVAVEVFNTLHTKPANSETTLMEVLGLVVPNASKVAEIDKVEADNLKQIKVYLTAPIDEAGDDSNWSIKSPKGSGKGKAKIDKNSDFKLSEDKMMVTITLTDAAEQQEKFDLKVKGLLEKDQEVKDLEFIDKEVPSVIDAQVIGIRTVKVMFSEPLTKETVQKNGNYEVKKGDKRIYVSRVELQKDGMSALVTLSSDLADGELEFKVKDLRDYAKFNILERTFELAVVKDTEKPTVIGYEKADLYGVTLVWSEDVKIKKDDKKYYYHTNSSNTVLEKPVIENGNKLKLSFYDEKYSKNKEHLLPSGTAYVYVNSGVVEDFWGNPNEEIKYTIEATRDLEAPKAEELKTITQSKVEVKFNEEVYLNKDSYEFELLNNRDKKQDVDITVVEGKGTKKLVFEFSKNIDAGSYTLVLKGIEDRAGNRMSATRMTFEMSDKTAPDANNFKVYAYKAGTKDQQLVVMFNEVMESESITNPNNFFLTKNGASYEIKKGYFEKDDVSFDVRDDGKTLVIDIPLKEDYNLKDYMDGKGKLRIGRLVDGAGNKMSTFSAELDIKNGDINEVTVKAEAKAENEILFTFSTNVINNLSIQDNLYIYADGKEVEMGESTPVLEDGETKLTIKTKNDYSTAAGTFTFTAKNNLAEDQFGAKLMPVKNGKVEDKAGPILKVVGEDKKISSKNGKLYITMSETLGDKYEKFIVEDLVLNFDGKNLKAQKDYTTVVSGSDIVVTIINEKLYKKMVSGRSLRVKSVKSPKYIIDLAGNTAKGFDDFVRVPFTGDKAEEPTKPEPEKPQPETPAGDSIKADVTSNMFGNRIEFTLPTATTNVEVFINDKKIETIVIKGTTVRASVGLDVEIKSAKVSIDGKEFNINLIKQN